MKKIIIYLLFQLNGIILLIGDLRSGRKVLRKCNDCNLYLLFDHTNVSDDAIKENRVVYQCNSCSDKHVKNNSF